MVWKKEGKTAKSLTMTIVHFVFYIMIKGMLYREDVSLILLLTLIPPSGGLHGSQFLVGKLFEVHKGYENETIIYSSSFLC